MNHDDQDKATERTALGEQRITIQDLLSRPSGKCPPTGEAWVRVAILDEEDLPAARGYRYQLSDPDGACEGRACHAVLTTAGLARLTRRHGTSLPWEDLLGAEVDVQLRADGHADEPATFEIVDVEEDWVHGQTEVALRYQMRSLAAVNQSDRQRFLAEPTEVRSIAIIRPEADPLWPSIKARLRDFSRTGVRIDDIPLEMKGQLGYMRVTERLEKMAHGRLPTPDILLIVSSEPDELIIREQIDTAALASGMPCPVIVGFGRGRYGSLLHDVAFSAAETPKAAVEIAWRMAQHARGADAMERRLDARIRMKNDRTRNALATREQNIEQNQRVRMES